VINSIKLSTRLGLAASLVAAACSPTQTAAFRGMTAVDHEREAATLSPGDDASPSEHLAAAKGLRDAEQVACAEVPESDRNKGPFARRDRILYVEEVRDRVTPKGPSQTFGVAVYLRATPGITEQWLDRVVECHRAHFAVVGVGATESPDPLLARDARVTVASTRDGFCIQITSREVDVGRTVLQQGRTLSANAS
jgi:hypothetical protein